MQKDSSNVSFVQKFGYLAKSQQSAVCNNLFSVSISLLQLWKYFKSELLINPKFKSMLLSDCVIQITFNLFYCILK